MTDGFRWKTWGKSIISHGLPDTTGEQESYGKKKFCEGGREIISHRRDVLQSFYQQ